MPTAKVSLAMRSRRGPASRGGNATAVTNTRVSNQLIVDSSAVPLQARGDFKIRTHKESDFSQRFKKNRLTGAIRPSQLLASDFCSTS